MSILGFVHATPQEEGASSGLSLAEVLHPRIVNDQFIVRHVSSAVPSLALRICRVGCDVTWRASAVLIRGRIHRQSDERLSGICDTALEHQATSQECRPVDQRRGHA